MLGPALEEVATLLLISGSEVGQRAAQHQNIIEAARKTGGQWIVYTGILQADTSSISLTEKHLAEEAALKDSGIPYTILRNGWYTENYTGTIAGALAGDAFIGSAGEGEISSAPGADFADESIPNYSVHLGTMTIHFRRLFFLSAG
jgi:NAD(P)H dehydrogenase (quinone)